MWLFLCRALDWSASHELVFYMLIPRIVLYILTLIIEMIKANIAVLPYAVGRRKPDGVTAEFDSPLSGKTANAVLANSITLTPGTITVSVEGNHFTVHCLAPGFDIGLETSVFIRQLEKMEKLTAKVKKSKAKPAKTKTGEESGHDA